MTINIRTLITVLGYAFVASNAHSNEQLADAKSCLGCHNIEQTVVGPSLKAVANKYKADPKAESYLVQKISQGGVGVWGSIPMPLMNVTNEEATTLAKWILSL
jgi:cytochrome c